MTTRRELLFLGLGGLGGCVVARDDNGGPDRATLLRRLLAGSVHGRADVGPVVYSWTRREQVESLAGDLASLFAPRPQIGTSTFARRGNAAPGQPLRFAWTNPWATVRGWNRRRRDAYGLHLLRLVLSPDAPEAAVLHEMEDHREVVLLGPAALESWSYGTAAIRSELHESAKLLESLARRAPLDAELAAAYRANLAHVNDNVAATPAQLLATADLLREAAAIQGPPRFARAPSPTPSPPRGCAEVW